MAEKGERVNAAQLTVPCTGNADWCASPPDVGGAPGTGSSDGG